MEQKNGFCFHIQSVSLCLFIVELSPFIIRPVITSSSYCVVVAVVVVVVCGDGGGSDVVLCFYSLGFAGVGLSVSSVFMGVANFLGLEFSF